jgi:hypothetical protein
MSLRKKKKKTRKLYTGVGKGRLFKFSHMDLCKDTNSVPRNQACSFSTALCLKSYGHKLKRVIS